MLHTHSCGARWSGERRGHCGGCHRTFSSLSAFQRHRHGFQCVAPLLVGLVAVQKPWGTCWSLPGSDERWETP
ncbi:MAG: hypothetical protein ACRDP6_47275 [Actinoallomurus sp.]